MVKTTDSRIRLDLARFGRTSLDDPTGRCALIQRDVRSVFVVVRQILTPKPSKVLFVQWDNVIHQLAASTADPPFSNSVLPRATQTRAYRFNAARLQKAENLITELRVSIQQDVTIRAGQRQSLAQLLDNPVCGRMFRAIEVQNSSSAMFNDKEAVERSKFSVGTVKKSKAAMTSRWLLRNASHRFALPSSDRCLPC
jgi:hypothetical protein